MLFNLNHWMLFHVIVECDCSIQDNNLNGICDWGMDTIHGVCNVNI